MSSPQWSSIARLGDGSAMFTWTARCLTSVSDLCVVHKCRARRARPSDALLYSARRARPSDALLYSARMARSYVALQYSARMARSYVALQYSARMARLYVAL